MRIFSTVQKLSGFGYSSKGKKMAVCFRDNIIDKSLCLTVKEKKYAKTESLQGMQPWCSKCAVAVKKILLCLPMHLIAGKGKSNRKKCKCSGPASHKGTLFLLSL